MRMGGMLSASSNTLLRWPESTKRVLENDPRNIAFALAFGLDAVLTGWPLLAALDAALAACCDV